MHFERFGKYLLLEKLAAGGMAEVYLAKTIGINNFVAIKRILPQFSENSEFIQMFKEEAKIAANLRHSNIVSIHYFGQEKGQLFLVMDFVEGQNLRQILNTLKKENKYLSIEQIVYLIREVASGLDYAHRALDNSTGRPLNIIHRDMSPQNVMISFEGEVKIVDFGIAKAETQVEQTQAGTIKGKFGYMSPEQAEGQELDSRTDVFSLGVILWELLSKERLFVGPNEAVTLKKVRDCQIPSLRKIDPNIPIELERITMKALNKNLDMRYSSASSFHKDLNRFLNIHYPEFSRTEFSKFMKSLFHEMFVENRKKLKEYSQIPVGNDEGMLDGNTNTATDTATLTEPNNTTDLLQNIPGIDFDIEKPTEKVEIKNLKIVPNNNQNLTTNTSLTSSQNQIGIQPIQFGQRVNTQTSPNGNSISNSKSGTYNSAQSIIYHQEPKQISSRSIIFFTLTLLAFLAWYFSGKYFKSNNPPLAGRKVERSTSRASIETSPQNTKSQVSASEQSSYETPRQGLGSSLVPINIQSVPSGAIVDINGRQSGITPYRGSLPAGEIAKIVVRKEGFISQEIEKKPIVGQPIRIEAVLQQEPPKGYLVVELIGAPHDVIVEINGKRIEDKSQLSFYAVPARVPVEIRALSPFSNSSTKTTVTVDVNQKRTVQLFLKKTQR